MFFSFAAMSFQRSFPRKFFIFAGMKLGEFHYIYLENSTMPPEVSCLRFVSVVGWKLSHPNEKLRKKKKKPRLKLSTSSSCSINFLLICSLFHTHHPYPSWSVVFICCYMFSCVVKCFQVRYFSCFGC